MSHKAKMMILLLGGVFAFAIVLLVAGVLLLSQPSNSTDTVNDDDDLPVSYTEDPDNVIDIGNSNELKNYKYAIITSENTIQLKNDLDEELDIILEKKNWQDITWSPDGKYIAVLGSELSAAEPLYDIYVYTIASKSWETITNFKELGNGVDGYLWKDDHTLLFTQGAVPERWLHSYNMNSDSEILKLNKVDAALQAIDANKEFLLFRKSFADSALFVITDVSGSELFKVENIESSLVALDIINVLFTHDSEKLVYLAKNPEDSEITNLYKSIIQSSDAVLVKDVVNFTPVCSINSDVLLGYTYIEDGNILLVKTVNVKQNLTKEIGSMQLESTQELDFASFECFNTNSLFFAITDAVQIKWNIFFADKGIKENTLLKNVVELSILSN